MATRTITSSSNSAAVVESSSSSSSSSPSTAASASVAASASASAAAALTPVLVLKKKGGDGKKGSLQWADDVVDNEGMGKKKSKSTLLAAGGHTEHLCSLLHIPQVEGVWRVRFGAGEHGRRQQRRWRELVRAGPQEAAEEGYLFSPMDEIANMGALFVANKKPCNHHHDHHHDHHEGNEGSEQRS